MLAAGAGRRFDPSGRQDKLLTALASGQPVVAAAAQAMTSQLDHVLALIRPGRDVLRNVLLAQGCEVLECADADLGMGAVLSAAIGEVERWFPDASACVVGLGDMPFVQGATVAKVAAALSDHNLCAPVWSGRRGHPVGFARCHFHALKALSGDEGARSLLARETERMHLIDVDDPGVIADIDFHKDLARGC